MRVAQILCCCYGIGRFQTAELNSPDTGYFSVLILIYLLTAIGLTPGGSSTVHIYTKTIHRTTQLTTLVGRLSGIRTQSGQIELTMN